MISCNVRPATVAFTPTLHTQCKRRHSLRTHPTLSFRNTLLDSSHERYSLIPAALKISSCRRVLIKVHAGSSSGGPLGEGSNDNKEPNESLRQSTPFDIKKFLVKLFQRAAAAAAVLSSIALALVALTPTLLSQPSGLNTALRFVNATVPAVTVEVDSVKAGWRRPLEIHGIRILEQNKKVLTKENATAGENKAVEKGRTLVDIEKIKSTGTLLDVCLLGRQTDVIVASPKVDVTMNENGSNLRIVQALQDTGLSPVPRISSESLQNKEEGRRGKEGEQIAGGSGAVAVASAPPAGVSSFSSLQKVTCSIPFSGEIRAGNIHVALTSGEFLAPTEFQEIFAVDKPDTSTENDGGQSNTSSSSSADGGSGKVSSAPQLHFEVLMGGETIEEEAQLEEQSAGFIDKTVTIGNKEESSLADWARKKPSVQLPSDVGYLTSPMAVRVDSNALKCTLAGWRTSAGYTYLASPVEAEMNLTPKLARVLMNRLNPLLGDAVELRGSSKITALITPSDQLWPSARLNVLLSPLHLNIGQGAAISRGLEVLTLADRKIGAAAKAAMLHVDISPLRAEIAADGKIVTKRVDLAVGVPGLGRPLHLVSYGTAHTNPTGAINMVLAIPADALELAGVTGLPDDFGVPISVHGTVARPSINLVKASKEVALLLIESKAKKVGPRGAEWMWQELKLGGDRSTFKIPEK